MSGTENRNKPGLTTMIFIALLLGAAAGALLHAFAADMPAVQNILIGGVFYVVGQGFIRLMQMLVVPLVFCSLVCGAAAIGDTKTLGKVGVKTIGFYLVTTMLAVAVALGVASVVNPGLGWICHRCRLQRLRSAKIRPAWSTPCSVSFRKIRSRHSPPVICCKSSCLR